MIKKYTINGKVVSELDFRDSLKQDQILDQDFRDQVDKEIDLYEFNNSLDYYVESGLDQWLYDIEIMGDFEFNGNKYDIKGDQE
jgi:hypothetical protein